MSPELEKKTIEYWLKLLIVRCRNYKFPFTWCWNDAAANDKNCVACVHKQRTQIRHSKSLSEYVQMFDDSYGTYWSIQWNIRITFVIWRSKLFLKIVQDSLFTQICNWRFVNNALETIIEYHTLSDVFTYVYWSLSHPLKRPDFYFAFFVQTEICVTFLSKYFFIWFFFSILSRSNLIDM